ncbi:MAG: YaaA family protein [Desulforegulaceae bacterium]|nr:YaaA family protein [Desulforegulaceae bacterium]
MLTLIGTSKTMRNSKNKELEKELTKPLFNEETKFLFEFMNSLSLGEISKIMKTSEKLSKNTVSMFNNFSNGKNKKNLTPAIYAFSGDVFKSIDIENYKKEDFLFAQKNLFILSGMYGILKPLDQIEPYRLEMGYVPGIKGFKKISDFWKNKITNYLNSIIDLENHNYIIDLASKEFTDSIDKKKLKLKLTNIEFKDEKDNKFRIIATYAKKARGAMADFIIKNRIEEKDDLKDFQGLGYTFNKKFSNNNNLVFTR